MIPLFLAYDQAMTRPAIILVAALALAGCAAPDVNRSAVNFNESQFSVDLNLCRGGNIAEASLKTIGKGALGSLAGALIAVDLDEETMAYTIGGVMVLLLIPVMTNKEEWLANTGLDKKKVNKGWVVFVFSIIGAYGGFVQTGVGIFLLSAMVLLANYSMVHANVIKNVIVLCYTIPTFFIYWWHDLINWELGLLVASGQMLGSWIAARFAMEHKSSDTWIRRLLVIMIVVSAFELLGIREWVISLI